MCVCVWLGMCVYGYVCVCGCMCVCVSVCICGVFCHEGRCERCNFLPECIFFAFCICISWHICEQDAILHMSSCLLCYFILLLTKQISVRKLFLEAKEDTNSDNLTTLLLLQLDSTKTVSILFVIHVYFAFGRAQIKY